MSFVGTHEYLAPEIIKGRYTIIKLCSCVLFSVLMKDEVKQPNFSFSIQCNNGRFVAPLVWNQQPFSVMAVQGYYRIDASNTHQICCFWTWPITKTGDGHGSAVDWWTFGIFLYELLYGKTPFKGSGNRATLFNVVGQPLKFPESATDQVSFAARDLIRGLLVKEPLHRLASKRGAAEIKAHPFFEGTAPIFHSSQTLIFFSEVKSLCS